MMTEQRVGLCETCKELKPVVYIDPVGREYCEGCFITLPVPTATRIMDFLWRTIPFQVGDRVECRTANIVFDGVGVIDEVSIDPANYGTPVYPSFRVRITKKAYPEAPDECWYMEAQLRRVSDD
jgi:hypothetical protein